MHGLSSPSVPCFQLPLFIPSIFFVSYQVDSEAYSLHVVTTSHVDSVVPSGPEMRPLSVTALWLTLISLSCGHAYRVPPLIPAGHGRFGVLFRTASPHHHDVPHAPAGVHPQVQDHGLAQQLAGEPRLPVYQ